VPFAVYRQEQVQRFSLLIEEMKKNGGLRLRVSTPVNCLSWCALFDHLMKDEDAAILQEIPSTQLVGGKYKKVEHLWDRQ
jgi:hypothetical protein